MLQTVNPPEPTRIEIALSDRGTFSALRWPGDPSHPRLVFCHATGFNAATYKSLLGPLSTHFRILAPDLRGHGLSPATAIPRKLKTWNTFALDLEDLIKHLGEPVVLAGHSMGGAVAMMMAARNNWRVRALVPVDPVMIPPDMARKMMIRRFLGMKPINDLAIGAARRRAVYGSREDMFRAYQGRGAFTTWPDEVLRDYIEGGTRDLPNGEVELSCAPGWEAATFSSAGTMMDRVIRDIEIPVHILYAETESTLRPQFVEEIRTRRPDWRLDQVPGTTHFAPMERPDAVREALLGFAQAPHPKLG